MAARSVPAHVSFTPNRAIRSPSVEAGLYRIDFALRVPVPGRRITSDRTTEVVRTGRPVNRDKTFHDDAVL